jgi:hypothetical protein
MSWVVVGNRNFERLPGNGLISSRVPNAILVFYVFACECNIDDILLDAIMHLNNSPTNSGSQATLHVCSLTFTCSWIRVMGWIYLDRVDLVYLGIQVQ